MGSPDGGDAPVLRDRAFLLLVVVVSLAFAWILWPLSGAIFWGTIIAIVFAPLNRRLGRAFSAGRAHLERAYRAALDGRYLWHEFGDLHLILP